MGVSENYRKKKDRSWHPLSWAPNPAKTFSIRIELRSIFLGLAFLGNHEEQAHWVPSRDTLVKTPTIVLTEQLESVPPLVQPLGCGVVWLRGKEPFFRLEMLDFESVCCGCLVSFRLISPSHPHLTGSRPPISDGAGEESTRVVGRRGGGLEELLTPPALDPVPEGVLWARWKQPSWNLRHLGGPHSPLLGTARAWFWSSSNLPSQSIRAPRPEKLRLHRFFTI